MSLKDSAVQVLTAGFLKQIDLCKADNILY